MTLAHMGFNTACFCLAFVLTIFYSLFFRILGTRHTVPVVGRVFNLTEIWEKSDEELAKSFYISPGLYSARGCHKNRNFAKTGLEVD